MGEQAGWQLGDFPFQAKVTTRWTDNDIYGHVNNALYFQYFDSVINDYLIARGGLDIHGGNIVGFIVRSECDYRRPVAYPGILTVGLAVSRLGTSSVAYAAGLFSDDDAACAEGRMVHVFVDRATSRPAPMPMLLRAALEALVTPKFQTQ